MRLRPTSAAPPVGGLGSWPPETPCPFPRRLIPSAPVVRSIDRSIDRDERQLSIVGAEIAINWQVAR